MSARVYRQLMQPQDLVGYQIRIDESDLMIFTERDYSREAQVWLSFYRRQVEEYIANDSRFSTSLEPVQVLSLIHILLTFSQSRFMVTISLCDHKNLTIS